MIRLLPSIVKRIGVRSVGSTRLVRIRWHTSCPVFCPHNGVGRWTGHSGYRTAGCSRSNTQARRRRYHGQSAGAQGPRRTGGDRSGGRDVALSSSLFTRSQPDRASLQQIEGASTQGDRAHCSVPVAQDRASPDQLLVEQRSAPGRIMVDDQARALSNRTSSVNPAKFTNTQADQDVAARAGQRTLAFDRDHPRPLTVNLSET
jgi:hypothetical protein